MVNVIIKESEKEYWDELVFTLGTSRNPYLVSILNASTFIMVGLNNSKKTMYDLEQIAIKEYELDDQGLKDVRKIITRYSVHSSEYREYLMDNGVYLDNPSKSKGTK